MSVMVILVTLLLVFLGLLFGSFINAFVWRFHEQAELSDRRFELLQKQAAAKKPLVSVEKGLARIDKQSQKLSIVHGRSMCVHCHHQLAARDLVPVFSFLMLKGKCRYCGKPIPDTPLAETVTPVLFALSYLFWPYGFHSGGLFQFVLWLVFLVGFVALALYDLKWQELPHDIVFALASLALVQVIVLALLPGGGVQPALKALYSVVIICGLFSALYIFSPKVDMEDDTEAIGVDSKADLEDMAGYSWGSKVFTALFGWAVRGRVSQWIGGGDLALGLLLGLLIGGPARAVLLIFLASLLGTLVAAPLLAAGKATRTTHLPFGPFLLAAAVIITLFGGQILGWYGHFLVGA